jgi:hypothetical protein
MRRPSPVVRDEVEAALEVWRELRDDYGDDVTAHGVRTVAGRRFDQLDARDLDRLAVVKVPALLSVATTARLLGCSPRTVRRRIAERSLPAVIEHGRIMVRGDELRAYIDGLERPGAPARRRRTRSPGGRFDFLRE